MNFFILNLAVALHLHPTASLVGFESSRNPGAGIAKDDHSTKVYKDGFAFMYCMRDGMETTADKYGEHRHVYSNTANVSIIRYTDSIDRERQQKMTHRVCFDFCRTVPEMVFFGLMNGRDCYCAPYVVRVPGDGVCNLPCPGDSEQMCGGKEMTGVYSMHACNDMAEELQEKTTHGEAVLERTKNAADHAATISGKLEATSDALMQAATEGGDMATNAFGQKGKAYAGEVKHAGEAAQRAADALEAAVATAKGLDGSDFSVPDNAKAAHAAEVAMTKLSEAAEEAGQAARAATQKAHPAVPEEEEELRASGLLFTPILPKVEQWLGMKPNISRAALQSTCDGELAGAPIIGLSAIQCSAACDAHASSHEDDYCVAYNHYHFHDGESICFLLKSVGEIWKYNCEHTQPTAESSAMECTERGTVVGMGNTDDGSGDFLDSYGDGCEYQISYPSFGCDPERAQGWVEEGHGADTGCCICAELLSDPNWEPEVYYYYEYYYWDYYYYITVVYPDLYGMVQTEHEAATVSVSVPQPNLRHGAKGLSNVATNHTSNTTSRHLSKHRRHGKKHRGGKKHPKKSNTLANDRHGKNLVQKASKKSEQTVQNMCNGRGAWLIQQPVKPALQVLDRCFGMQMEGTEV